MMKKKHIEEEFDRFFEFPTDDRTHVTSTSAKLFALHIARPLLDAIKQTLSENRHLADGDNCTLIELKRVIGEE